MTPERWQQIQQILDTACEVPEEKRWAVVAEACAGDQTLQEEVETLLSHDDEVDNFIEEPLWNLNRQEKTGPEKLPDALQSETGPRRVGHYRIEKLLGEGGMGEVFLAVREDDYEQRVALKLVSKGASRADLLSRFYTERQILAHLQHPDIARLLDGGALEDGRPYFVMEYVEGEPIDRYCAKEGLSLRRRLQLFQRVCAAVHYAHQNLVVHRDLKASNILVTAEGEPRLLDFGIAKLLQTGGVAGASATMPGLVPMTPANASPEQILDEPITTACDIYALGVLLYRILAGRPPYRIEEFSFAELVQVICLDEPKKPSTAVLEAEESTADVLNQEAMDVEEVELEELTSPLSPHEKRRLRRRLEGDLDAIVMKALRKEPDQRYGSAAEMAEDIRRHLVGLPVMALRGTWVYYSTKFIRRNKLAIVALLLIVGFAITATVQRSKALDERAQAIQARTLAEHNQDKAEEVTEFLTELFESADPDSTRGAEVSVRELLERGKLRIESELTEQPDIRAEILGTLGTVYQGLGLYSEALELKRKALDSRREVSTEDDPELADHINNLAKVLRLTGDYAKAEETYRKALKMRERLGEESREIARTQNNLASALMSQGKYDQAEQLFLEALETRRDLDGDNRRDVAVTLNSLGALYLHLGDFPSAEHRLQEALSLRSLSLGPQNTKVASTRSTLAQVFHGQRKLTEARESFEQALEVLRQLYGVNHFKVAMSERGYAALLLELGETSKACTLAEHSLSILQVSRPAGDWVVADAESVLGHCLLVKGHYQEAEGYLQKGYTELQIAQGEKSYFTRRAQDRIIQLYETWGKQEQAEAYRNVTRAFELSESKNEPSGE